MDWFRFYGDAMDDAKVLSISDKDLRLWMRLLCLASKNDGNLPSIPTLSKLLRVRLDYVQGGVERLLKVGLIDKLAISSEQYFAPHGWSKRQYKSDISTSRVAKHRGEMKRYSNASRATDTDTDTDTDTYPLTPKGEFGGEELSKKSEKKVSVSQGSKIPPEDEQPYEWQSAFADYPHPAITNSEKAYLEFQRLSDEERSMLMVGAMVAGSSQEFVSKRDRGYGVPFDKFIKSRGFIDAYNQFNAN